MDELFKCVFAKHWLAKSATKIGPEELAKAYRSSFALVKQSLPGVFEEDTEIEIDPVALGYVDHQLDIIGVDQCQVDIFSELYEAFAESGIKSSEGQFFTPTEATRLLVAMTKPEPGMTVCDPACGAGGFLMAAAERMLAEGGQPSAIASSLYGIDKDEYLSRIARGRLALYLDHLPQLRCGDSLSGRMQDGGAPPAESYDLILTNPPFGAKIVSGSRETLDRYDLARRWVRDEFGTGDFIPTGGVNESTPPQVLFLERCIKWLKPGGTLGAILPESIVSTKSYAFVVQYIEREMSLSAVIGMPESLFKTSGKGGTHTKTVALVARRKPTKERRTLVFFAEAKWCGHDSRGRTIPNNDLPRIADNYDRHSKGEPVSDGHFGVAVPRKNLAHNLAPRAFSFDHDAEFALVSTTHDVVTIGDLLANGTMSMATGDEVGKLAYGTGAIPFVRTSDLSNWEIKSDPKHSVSEETWLRYASRQDVRPEDILLVRDGTYLIGTCAMVTDQDLPLLYQSHLYKLRVERQEELSPYLLLAALTSTYAQRQIRSFCVSQDIIDSLGSKIREVRLPIPKQPSKRQRVAAMVEESIRDRARARELARSAVDLLNC